MKPAVLILFFLSLFFISAAQTELRAAKKSMLIYDSMDLQRIIPQTDLLNKDFKNKEHGNFYAIKQARANYVYLGNIKDLKPLKDLDRNMPVLKFMQKYPGAKWRRNVLVTQELETDFAGDTVNHFCLIDPLNDDNFLEDFDLYDKRRLPLNYKEDSTHDWRVQDYDVKSFPENYEGKVIYHFHGGYDNPEYNFIEAFYFLEDMTEPLIPEPYSAMLNYNGILFDPETKVYKSGYPANMGDFMFFNKYPDNVAHDVDSFLNLITDTYSISLGQNYNYCSEENFQKKIDSVKLMQIRNKLSESPSLSQLFDNAVNAAINDHHSNGLFEYLTGQLISLEKELLIKRGRLPNRACGNDNAPKIQDYTIAVLALKTGNVKLFLNAHKYVISDRTDFRDTERPDMAEIDFIHINAAYYFMGSYLSSSRKNNSGWNRFGKWRELYSFQSTVEIEGMILDGIANKRLDDFNRISLAQLFARYCFNGQDKIKQHNDIERLKESAAGLPDCVKFDYAKYVKSIKKNR